MCPFTNLILKKKYDLTCHIRDTSAYYIQQPDPEWEDDIIKYLIFSYVWSF